jgi:hypothetical protein
MSIDDENLSETDEITYSLGGGKNDIRLSFGTFKGTAIVALRKWYRDTKGEFRPTRKGIAMMATNFRALLQLIQNHKTEIDGWLNGKGERSSLKPKRARADMALATRDVYNEPSVEFGRKSLPREVLWEYLCHGASEFININKDHPLDTALVSAGAESDMSKIVAAIAFSASMIVDDDEMSGREFLDMFMMNLSSKLRRSLRSP